MLLAMRGDEFLIALEIDEEFFFEGFSSLLHEERIFILFSLDEFDDGIPGTGRPLSWEKLGVFDDFL